MIDTFVFAALALLIGGLLAYAFAPADWATLRRAVRRRRVRQQTAAIWYHGVDLAFWLEQLRATKPDRRIRARAHHTLTGGAR